MRRKVFWSLKIILDVFDKHRIYNWDSTGSSPINPIPNLCQDEVLGSFV